MAEIQSCGLKAYAEYAEYLIILPASNIIKYSQCSFIFHHFNNSVNLYQLTNPSILQCFTFRYVCKRGQGSLPAESGQRQH